MSKSNNKPMIILASKPRNHLALAVKKRHAGLHITDKNKSVNKGVFKSNLKKGLYDV